MPLIQMPSAAENLLQAAGLVGQKKTLKEILKDNSIDTDEAIGIVSAIAHCGDSDAIKLRAAEMALKMSGDLTVEETKVPFVCNIIIKDSQSIEVNPILIPR